MVKFINDNDLFYCTLHGARDWQSTITQLIEQHDKNLEYLETGKVVELIYSVFLKAFDMCDLLVLLTKVRKVEFGGRLLK